MGTLFCTFQVYYITKCHYEGPYKRVAEGFFTDTQRRKSCTCEAERNLKMWPQAKECQEPPETERQGMDSPLEPPKQAWPANTLNLAQWYISDFWPSEL